MFVLDRQIRWTDRQLHRQLHLIWYTDIHTDMHDSLHRVQNCFVEEATGESSAQRWAAGGSLLWWNDRGCFVALLAVSESFDQGKHERWMILTSLMGWSLIWSPMVALHYWCWRGTTRNFENPLAFVSNMSKSMHFEKSCSLLAFARYSWHMFDLKKSWLCGLPKVQQDRVTLYWINLISTQLCIILCSFEMVQIRFLQVESVEWRWVDLHGSTSHTSRIYRGRQPGMVSRNLFQTGKTYWRFSKM